jgi:hypothetical protein
MAAISITFFQPHQKKNTHTLEIGGSLLFHPLAHNTVLYMYLSLSHIPAKTIQKKLLFAMAGENMAKTRHWYEVYPFSHASP